MPRWRKLHVKTRQSLDINEMPDDFTRLLWVLMPLGLDREGRGLDNVSWVKAQLMPLRTDVTLKMVSAALEWYEGKGMIARYAVNGRAYFHVPTFTRYQGDTSREAESEFPAPPGTDESEEIHEPVTSQSRATQEPVVRESSSDSDADSAADSDSDSAAAAAALAEMPEQLLADILQQPITRSDRKRWRRLIADYGVDIGRYAVNEAFECKGETWGYIATVAEAEYERIREARAPP